MRKLSVIEMNRLSPEEFRRSEKVPIVVVLDRVRSLYNVGSVMRTADAMALEAVYLCEITATPPHPEIHKTALGAEDTVSWKYFQHTLDAVKELKGRGYEIWSVEQCEGSTLLQNIEYKVNTKEKIAIILGNEVKGVQQEVVNASDGCMEIPQFGTKHSMNVSVTAGMVIWHLCCKQVVDKC